jgi:DNA replication protein DnaC
MFEKLFVATSFIFAVSPSRKSSLPEPANLRSLRSLEWVSRHENLVVCGPSGTAKSHLLEALGYGAIESGHEITWFSLEDLGALLHRDRADGTMARAVRRLMGAELIIIDDIGPLAHARVGRPMLAQMPRLRAQHYWRAMLWAMAIGPGCVGGR